MISISSSQLQGHLYDPEPRLLFVWGFHIQWKNEWMNESLYGDVLNHLPKYCNMPLKVLNDKKKKNICITSHKNQG